MTTKKVLSLVLLIPLLLILTSCGEVMNQTGGGNEGVTGLSTLSGTIIVSTSDSAKVSAGDIQAQAGSEVMAMFSSAEAPESTTYAEINGGIVRIFLINDDGTPVYTGISVQVDTNGHYTVPNLGEGSYVLKFIKIGEDANGNDWKLIQKAFISIDGVNAASANITPITGAGTEYMVQEIFDAVNDNNLDKETAQEVYDKANQAYSDALSNGDITKADTTERVNEGTDYSDDSTDYEKNYGDETINTIGNNDEVQTETKKAKLKAKLSQPNMSLEDAKSLIRDIFAMETQNSNDRSSGVSSSQNGPPEFFIEQFAQAYLRGNTVTIPEFATAYNASVLSDNIKNTYWTVAQIITSLNYFITNGEIKYVYDVYDEVISDDSNIPIFAKAVFPENLRVDINSSFSVPQAIALFMLSGLMDGSSLPQSVQDGLGNEGPPMNPYSFCQQIGWVQLESDQVYITESDIHPVKAWKEINTNTWGEVDALEVKISILETGQSADVARVVLDYPASGGGRSNVDLVAESGGQGNTQSEPTNINTMTAANESDQIMQYNEEISAQEEQSNVNETRWVIMPWSGNNNNIAPVYVEDFAEGTAIIKVLNSQAQEIKRVTIQLMKPNIGYPVWEFPKGPNMNTVQTQGWDPSFEPQRLDIDQTTGKAKLRAIWSAPAGTIPDGFELVYSINLGKSYMKVNWEQSANFPNGDYDWEDPSGNNKWEHIWSSWEDNRFIKGSSFIFKNDLEPTTVNIINNYQTRYEVNITPLLMNKANGRIAWQGSNSRTEFFVGTDNPWSITLNGTVSFPSTIEQHMQRNISGDIYSGTWKIGLFLTGQPGNNGDWEDMFWSNTSGERTPLETQSFVPIVANLGTLTAVNNGYEATYELPVFTKIDLEKHKNYQIYVWYDYDSTPQQSYDQAEWDAYGSAVNDAIDFLAGGNNNYSHPLEQTESAEGDIWMDSSMLRYNTWGQNQNWRILNGNPTNQIININFGAYWANNN